MFKFNELYEWLMEEPLDEEGDRMIWEGLATKFYMEFGNVDPNKLFDVTEKAKSHGVTIPNEEMKTGWLFIKEFVEGKNLTPQELEKLADEYTKFTSGANPTDI